MKWWARLWWGVLGASAPIIFNFYRVVSGRSEESLPSLTPEYFGVAVAYVLVSGFLAVALNSSNPFNAMYVGATAPVIVSGWLK
jgi:hypothetical protein